MTDPSSPGPDPAQSPNPSKGPPNDHSECTPYPPGLTPHKYKTHPNRATDSPTPPPAHPFTPNNVNQHHRTPNPLAQGAASAEDALYGPPIPTVNPLPLTP